MDDCFSISVLTTACFIGDRVDSLYCVCIHTLSSFTRLLMSFSWVLGSLQRSWINLRCLVMREWPSAKQNTESRNWHGKKQAQPSHKLMATVALKLMIIVCHLFAFNWVCNRNKWAYLWKMLLFVRDCGGVKTQRRDAILGNRSKKVEKYWVGRTFSLFYGR